VSVHHGEGISPRSLGLARGGSSRLPGAEESYPRHDGAGHRDDADVDGSDQAAYLRYASDVVEVVETYVYRLFMSVVTVARLPQSGPPGRLPAVHAHRPSRHHRCGDRARLMPVTDE
jgi:hypothetical protein